MSAITINKNEIVVEGARITLSDLQSINISNLFDWQFDIVKFLKQWLDNSDTIRVKSSGSTGEPKQIELAKSTMIMSAKYTLAYLGLIEGSQALLCMPIEFIGSKMMIVRSIVAGLKLHIIKASANIQFQKEIDFSALTPHQCLSTLSQNPGALNSIREIIIGGGSIDPSLQELIESSTTNFYSSFGMTETSSHIALRPINGPHKSDYFHLISKEIKISTNEDSCLIIEAQYLGDTPIHTNDIIKISDPGHFKWLGRSDNVINSGGIKIHPEIVENKLKNKLLQPFIIFGLKDKLFQEKVCILIEGDRLENIKEITKIFNNVLRKYEIPKGIFLTKKLIKTSNGKIDRIKSLAEDLKKITE